MIIYKAKKDQFLADIEQIDQILVESFRVLLGRRVGQSEQDSWKRSLRKMRDVLRNEQIPSKVGVALEFQIPQTSKRIDFVISGLNKDELETVVIIELKQWEKVELTTKDGVVFAPFYGVDAPHPSYQAWSYAELLQNFNKTVYTDAIQLKPCAYLHNYIKDEVIENIFYQDYLEKAPVFLEGDLEKERLQEFIIDNIHSGDEGGIISRIEKSEIRPSKSLTDSLVKMLEGNKEFIMIDDQKVAYETVLEHVAQSSPAEKRVIIVEGGPGTGKSVIAINLLVAITGQKKLAKYVTKNVAPRNVYETLLSGTMRKSKISSLFSGSGSFVEEEDSGYDVLIVDEAHRLTEKSGIFQNKGENQIKELIAAANCTVFFIDEQQKVTWKDIGKKSEIEAFALQSSAKVVNLKLTSQFRCNGSDGYLAWLNNTLQIEETANETLDTADFDFRILNSPIEVQQLVLERNKIANKSRIVAGYCWNWISKKDSSKMDIEFPEYNFAMKWNLANEGPYILGQESVHEIGCIHTVQGLELDYVGVIVGDDLVVRSSVVQTNPSKRARTDKSLNGFRNSLKKDRELALKTADEIIKNTYKVLMTRGMKGCYVYFTDKETAEYFRSRIKS